MLRTAKPCVSRTRKPQLYGATPWAVVSLLLLACESFARVACQSRSQQTEYATLRANDFVNAKSYACKKKTSARRLAQSQQQLRKIRENDYYWLLNDFEQTNYLQNGQQIQQQEYTQTE